MLKEMLERREELLDAVDHACWQMRHMARRYRRDKEPARMPKARAFDMQALLLAKISEG